MSSTAADERPRLRREATREALIEATAQTLLDEDHPPVVMTMIRFDMPSSPGTERQ